jgi:hypothetical protein
MKKNNLKKLGFKKVKVSKEESGDKKFHYYTLDICNGVSFITNSNDSIKDNNWIVEFLNTDLPIVFTDYKELKLIISIFNKNLQNDRKIHN